MPIRRFPWLKPAVATFTSASAELTLEARPNVLYSSLAFGFLAMVVLCSRPLQYIPITRQHGSLLDIITRYADVAVIQFLSLCALFVLAYRYYRHVTSLQPKTIILFVCVFLPSMLIAEVVAEEFVLKPTFHYTRPVGALDECAVTSRVLKTFGLDSQEGTSAPSGFALRQTALLLFFLLLSHQKRWREVFSKHANRLLHWVQYFVFALVIALRFFRGRHSLFDIGVGIGIGVVVFWLITLFINTALRPGGQNRKLLAEFVAPLGTYCIAIMFYSQDTRFWMMSSLIMLMTVGLLYRLRERLA